MSHKSISPPLSPILVTRKLGEVEYKSIPQRTTRALAIYENEDVTLEVLSQGSKVPLSTLSRGRKKLKTDGEIGKEGRPSKLGTIKTKELENFAIQNIADGKEVTKQRLLDEANRLYHEQSWVPHDAPNLDSGWIQYHIDHSPVLQKRKDLKLTRNFALILLDGHQTRKDEEVLRQARLQRILLLRFPPHTTHLCQPLDRFVFARFKKELYSNFVQPETSGIMAYRQELARVLPLALGDALHPKTIQASFRQAGVWPTSEEPLLIALQKICKKQGVTVQEQLGKTRLSIEDMQEMATTENQTASGELLTPSEIISAPIMSKQTTLDAFLQRRPQRNPAIPASVHEKTDLLIRPCKREESTPDSRIPVEKKTFCRMIRDDDDEERPVAGLDDATSTGRRFTGQFLDKETTERTPLPVLLHSLQPVGLRACLPRRLQTLFLSPAAVERSLHRFPEAELDKSPFPTRSGQDSKLTPSRGSLPKTTARGPTLKNGSRSGFPAPSARQTSPVLAFAAELHLSRQAGSSLAPGGGTSLIEHTNRLRIQLLSLILPMQTRAECVRLASHHTLKLFLTPHCLHHHPNTTFLVVWLAFLSSVSTDSASGTHLPESHPRSD
ncbi:hypothetical protein BLNAU_12837 [Blattamonas nauphoetae]|uniref:DDE-1 domain-containing protein n=1 Tax=Blattamonas nauphoetae TaxID=2049346 RepID=A0ABQ9XLT1_9EUKA|nr:hypothetical protein BLNAU_12837 [Blattamonas nauphoetae]